MNQKEFKLQSDYEKITEVSEYGTYLQYIIKGPYLVKLYQYEGFYVETYFHIQKDRIDSILTFDKTNKLAPYLKKTYLIIPLYLKQHFESLIVFFSEESLEAMPWSMFESI